MADMKSIVKVFTTNLLSIKVLLILAFICLMAISGFLGYILTSIQAQKSMNTVAELSMLDAANSVSILVKSKIAIGHQLNEMESAYFFQRHVTLDSWPVAYHQWRPMTTHNLMSVKDSYVFSLLAWAPNFALAINSVAPMMVAVTFNQTVCNDTVNFPGSNCSVWGEEVYPIDPVSYQPIWNVPIMINLPYNQSVLDYWKTGPMARTGPNWRTSASNRFSRGYSAIYPTPTPPRFLILQANVAVLDADGRCVGQMGKDLLLAFLGVFLNDLVTHHELLAKSGRAFVMESRGGFLTGASHGEVFRERPCPTCDYGVEVVRVRIDGTSDVIIATAGKEILQITKDQPIGSPPKVKFSAVGQSFLHVGMPLTDEYGLAWVVSVVLSLTALFEDIDRAAMQMLGYTALAIISLAIVASLLISYLVTAPLRQLSDEMEEVAEMNLDGLQVKFSRFKEILVIQNFFVGMVQKLKEFRAYLPEAILNGGSGEGGEEAETANEEIETRPSNAYTNHSYKPTTDVESSDGDKSVVSGTTGSRNSSDTTRRRHNKRRSMARHIGLLNRRTVSSLHVDINRFHSLLTDENSLVSIHSSVIEAVAQAVQEHSGVCNPFSGDKLIAFWNVRTAKSDHYHSCVCAALKIHSTIQRVKSAANAPVDARIACTAGVALFGTMGTSTVRAFTIVSTCIPRGFVVQKLAKLIPASVLCDSAMYEFAQYYFVCRMVAEMRFPNDLTERVFEIVASKQAAKTDEWMYELDNQNSDKSREMDFTLGVRSLFAGQEASAKQYFNTHLEKNPNDPTAKFYLEHMNEIPPMIHKKYGFMFPVSMLCIPSKQRHHGDN